MVEHQELINNLIQTIDQLKVAIKQENIPCSQMFDAYFKSLEGSGSSRALANKMRIIEQLRRDFDGMYLHDLDYDVLNSYMNGWSSKTYVRRGINNYYSQTHIDKVYTNLRLALSYALKMNWIYRNPMDDVKCPNSKAYSEEVQAMTNEEMQMILNVFSDNPQWYAAILILMFTGARPGELFALRFDDFSSHKNTVRIRRALSLNAVLDVKEKKVESSEVVIKRLKNEVNGRNTYARREITVGPKVIAAVENYRQHILSNPELMKMRIQNGTEDFLFTAPTDGKLKRPCYYNNRYQVMLKRKGISSSQYNLYRFRHTYCTNLFTKYKLSPKIVQQLMGDNSLDMVMQVYHSVNKDDVIQASAIYADSLNEEVL